MISGPAVSGERKLVRCNAAFDPTFFERDALFWPIAPAARAFAEHTAWPSIAEYGSRVAHAAPVRFREQPKKPRRHRRGEASARDLYDGRIVEQGWVPTRPESWHDFLNMLVWAAFPAAKWQLHVRQHRAQSARLPPEPVRALPNARTRELDALALLDEGGAVVLCRPDRVDDLRTALAERRAADARALFAHAARAVIFGHAIYEDLVLRRDTTSPDPWAAALIVPTDAPISTLESPALAFTRAVTAESASLTRAADAALARELATEGTFLSPGSLSRLDLGIIRP